MAKYRSIQTTFWSDSKVIDDFTPEDRYFYLYLLTNEKSNQLGCYELSIKQMCRDTGYNEETIKKLVDRFENNFEVINYDYKTKEIFLKNWHKYNWLNSENTKKCVNKEFDLVKSSVLKDLISPLYAPYIPLPSNKKKKKKKKNNKKNECDSELSQEDGYAIDTPTLADVISYGAEIGASVQYCEKFFDNYESTGWVDKNNVPIKSWKAKLRYWFNDDVKKGNTKDENKKEYDTRMIYTDRETGKDFQYDKEGNKHFL